MSPSPLKIAVFGGTGFIGRYVVRRLARRGVQVLVPTRTRDRALPLVLNGDPGQIVPLVGRIDDDVFVRGVCRQADAVINLVGIMFEGGRNTFDAIQAKFPAFLAGIARSENVKALIHVSAIGADKNSPSAYARSKAEGEAGVLAAFPEATIIRPSIVVGAEDDFFNHFGRLMRFLPFLPLIGGGKTMFQPVVVGDVADAIVAALDEPSAAGKIYELGGPAKLTFKECLQLLKKETGRPHMLVPVPYWIMSIKAMFMQFLPSPFKVTPDQIKLLKRDNIASPSMAGFGDLGLVPSAIELVLPTYLDRYRTGGRYKA
jgi:uncharacterized protein YbjT (DUF2867 family)